MSGGGNPFIQVLDVVLPQGGTVAMIYNAYLDESGCDVAPGDYDERSATLRMSAVRRGGGWA